MIGAPDALQNGDGGGAANAPKLHVTFDETITVKNDTDLVVKKPLKLELVIENWKPNNVQTAPEIVTQSNPGKVRRLVDEYNNSIEEVSLSPDIMLNETLSLRKTYRFGLMPAHIFLCKFVRHIFFFSYSN